jgi:hypothetical protein
MGKTNNKNIDADGTNGTENNSSTKSTSKRGRPRKDPAAANNGNGTETETVVPKLVLVEVPEPDDEEPAAPAEKTKAAASKKAAPKKRKDVNLELKKEQLSVLIKTIFDIAASRQGFEIWKLSKDECILLSEPLANILNRNPYFDKVASTYGDYLALLIALGTIILPRAIVQVKSKKEPKKEKVTYVNQTRLARESGNESGTVRTSDNTPNGQPTTTRPNFGAEFHNYIPAIQ